MNRFDTQRGFTLVEMAIVLVIMALLLGGVLAPLSTQKEQEKRVDTAQLIEAALQALTGFAIINGRLPCPDSDAPADGRENACPTGTASFTRGALPWVDLGLASGADDWGNPLGYAVNGGFADPAGFALTTAGTGAGILRVFAAAPGNCNAVAGDVAENVPAVVWSGAKTGYASNDETENTDADRCFVSKDYNTVANQEFDDLINWLSPNILFNRMVSAGSLP
jgi:prepilin-type N-terminal cleavage/methylation domain-containing protein